MRRTFAIVAAVCIAASARASDFVFFDGFESVLHPVTGAVIVSEIMSNPTAVTDDKGEWFELTNVSAQTVDLGGCIVSQAALQSVLPAFAFAPGAQSVVARNTDLATNGNVPAFATFAFALGATGSITLGCDSRLIDTTSWPNELAGHSRTLDPRYLDALGNDNAANWCFSTLLYNTFDAGTPDSSNETCP